MRYRRVYIEGGSYFFTVITEKRRKIFADDDNVKRLRAAFKPTYPEFARYFHSGPLGSGTLLEDLRNSPCWGCLIASTTAVSKKSA